MDTQYSKLTPLSDPQQMFSLKGRVGLITGGAGKMGRQFAATLARAGATVIVSDLDPARCEEAACETGTASVIPMACDVSDRGQVRELFSRIRRDYKRLDFFVSNVMGKPEGYYAPLEEYSEETWEKVLGVNLSGTFYSCQEALPLLRDSKSPSIVITSSIYGTVGPDQRIYESCDPRSNPYGGKDRLNTPAAYSASKGGLVALSRHLATQFGAEGIRVNTLTPGGVYDGQEAAFHEAYTSRVPLGRMADWSDYNGAVLFLVSDASRYMTGTNLILDGGWSAW